MASEKDKRVIGKMDENYTEGGAPAGRDPTSNQHRGKKGFVRPVRMSYRHVGVRPKQPLRDLTDEEKERYADVGYVAFEAYPEGSALIGRYWTKKQLASGCGTVTSTPVPIAETFARDPNFYGATFCCGCHDYFPVGEDGEFVWLDDEKRVGA